MTMTYKTLPIKFRDTEKYQKSPVEAQHIFSSQPANPRLWTLGGVVGHSQSSMIFLSRHHPRMGNFLLTHRTDSTSRNRYNRNCLARQRHELDLVSGSIPMNHHNPAHVSSFQPFFGLVLRQYGGISSLIIADLLAPGRLLPVSGPR